LDEYDYEVAENDLVALKKRGVKLGRIPNVKKRNLKK